jgi:hypothetical protein
MKFAPRSHTCLTDMPLETTASQAGVSAAAALRNRFTGDEELAAAMRAHVAHGDGFEDLLLRARGHGGWPLRSDNEL